MCLQRGRTELWKMPDNEIHINTKWNTDMALRYHNLRHELEEMHDFESGMEYWQAHKSAQKTEKDIDLETIKLPKSLKPDIEDMTSATLEETEEETIEEEKPVYIPAHYRNRPERLKKPKDFDRQMREKWGEEPTRRMSYTRKPRRIEPVDDTSGLRKRYYLGRELPVNL